MTCDPQVSSAERALYAIYCGNLDALLPVCNKWEDALWAHLRTLVDHKIETTLRYNLQSTRKLVDLPKDFNKRT